MQRATLRSFMRIFQSVCDTVGHTPLVALKRYQKKHALCAFVAVKLESLNFSGSVKDRAACAMVEEAEKSGALKRGGLIVEPTSGNTGIALSAIGAAKGYRVVLTMPDTMSEERRALMAAYGAEIVLTQGRLGMKGAVERAQEICFERGGIMLGQFENAANVFVHERTTAREIWEDTEGMVAAFVAGVGTGGTFSGVGKYLKARNSTVKTVAVEPLHSPVLSKGKAGAHTIEGIGANFLPPLFERTLCDEIISVNEEDAKKACRELAACEGILAGISSGAALVAATEVASRVQMKGKLVVTLFPDGGSKYFSTGLFG